VIIYVGREGKAAKKRVVEKTMNGEGKKDRSKAGWCVGGRTERGKRERRQVYSLDSRKKEGGNEKSTQKVLVYLAL